MSAIEELIGELAKLPGIGRKTATRLTYFLLKQPREAVRRLAGTIQTISERVRPCSDCGNLGEGDVCDICADPRRDRSVLCVVEEASDIGAIERAGEYPLAGVGPADLRIGLLASRLGNGSAVREVIVATNPSMEGEVTATYVRGVAESPGVRVTRIALGLPVGGDLEYADSVTIAQALAARREMST